MQSNDTALADLPDVCREAPAASADVAASGDPVSVKQRSSSTTLSSKSLSSSVDVEDRSSSGADVDEQCGWGPVHPRCCQVFRNAKVVLFFLCCLATIQVTPLLCLLRIHYFRTYLTCEIQCVKTFCPLRFSKKIFPNGWELLSKILHGYYMFISMPNYKIVFNYIKIWQSYAILSATSQWIFTFHDASSMKFYCLMINNTISETAEFSQNISA